MRVLFVDDNAMNRKVVKSMLESAEVVMIEAEDAETGLSILDADAFDLVLMDLRMPGMDGLAAIRQIRARGDAKASLPIIVVTADNGPNIRGQALAAGAEDLLHKPVQMQALFDAIGRAVEGTGRPGAVLA
ncbi:MAG: response regulator [Phenylobacterium sp. RIFCSPHIGHO2_01_FULL_69_31]|uniref:response regulator n=1 Tax=Phenylobacterium sp. RIFCSPHIGHO2_01_FULL_69_31 TaxID=1801944 RepID=UPI0008AD3EF0|nr:response regulator [Phenylobacterium sp. RIFCSPHIGHO2_01_FULL_69_31]OHB29135.1 MAG: response regulator [Phenylobacterium sp. RIFCSPHIGHO2_01_FULL_69_31]